MPHEEQPARAHPTSRRPGTTHTANPMQQRTSFALLVVGLALALSCWAGALAQPFWKFTLYAPQYPHGLTLLISLTGLSGDVREVDMLNHYIGMAHLDQAAAMERRAAIPAVAMMAAVAVAIGLWGGRKLLWILPVLGAGLPVGFLVDSYYWLHHFGHHLDPKAPLHIPTFTPQLFGNGEIGQFMTFAVPQLGFWCAVCGAVLLFGVAVVRYRMCQSRLGVS